MQTDTDTKLDIEEEDDGNTEPGSGIAQFDDDDRPGEDEDRGDNLDTEGAAEPEPEPEPEPAPSTEGKEGKDGEAAGEGDDAEAGEDGEDEQGYIPKARFNQVNTRMRMAEAELERYRERERQKKEAGQGDEATDDDQGAQAQPEQVDLKALRKERNEAMFEGDMDKADELEDKIAAEMERRATERAMATITAREQQRVFQSAVQESIKQYPFLDSQSDQANKEAIDEVVEWRDFYIESKGLPPADALRKAVSKVGPSYASAGDKGKEDEGGGEGEDDPKANGKEEAAARKRTIIKRNAEMNQPPETGKNGTGQRAEEPTTKDIESMTDDEFDALPEAEKAKYRGD